MILTKQQTLNILYQNVKRNSLPQRYRYTTKFKIRCLKCHVPLYISYNVYGRNAIFCKECFSLVQQTETMAQYQYMRVIKERQLALIEKYQKTYVISGETNKPNK